MVKRRASALPLCYDSICKVRHKQSFRNKSLVSMDLGPLQDFIDVNLFALSFDETLLM